jgi:hypothetical protein
MVAAIGQWQIRACQCTKTHRDKRQQSRGASTQAEGAQIRAGVHDPALPKRAELGACVRIMRLWDSSHALEPGDMYTSIVFVYTTTSVSRVSNPACAVPRFLLELLLHSPLVEKGQ